MLLIAVRETVRHAGLSFAARCVPLAGAEPMLLACPSPSTSRSFATGPARARQAPLPFPIFAGARTAHARVRDTSSSVRLFANGPILQRNLSLWPFGQSNGAGAPADAANAPSAQPSHSQDFQGDATLIAQDGREGAPFADNIDSAASSAQTAMEGATREVETLVEAGAFSSWPNVRLVQEVLDWLVSATGMPWWLTIALVTLSVRLLVLPVVLRSQKNGIKMAAINPKLQQYMKDIQLAKKKGDHHLMNLSSSKVQMLFKENDCSPFRSLLAPMVQAPVFMTFFFALRGIAEIGLPSLKTGGLFWFRDLIVCDPYYVLPIISCLTSLAVLETGAELGGAKGQQGKMFKNILRAVLVGSVVLVCQFPAAVLCFWVTNNFLSLIQLFLLQTQFARRYLGLPPKHKPTAEDLAIAQDKRDNKLTGWESFKESFAAGQASQGPPVAHVVPHNPNRNAVPSSLRAVAPSSVGGKTTTRKPSAMSRAVSPSSPSSLVGAKTAASKPASDSRERALRQLEQGARRAAK